MKKHIIQIGACGGKDELMSAVGLRIDNTQIHLIEPLESNFKRLKENYEPFILLNDIKFYNCAISNYTGNLKLYYQKELRNNINNLDEHCSFSHDHLVTHGHSGNIAVVKVLCYSFTDFIAHNGLDGIIEHLYIDTEGHDCDIILSIDFNKHIINNITFETVHSDGPFVSGSKLQKTIDYLKENNYKVIKHSNFDITVSKLFI
jgi:FkbM family methyltransferase